MCVEEHAYLDIERERTKAMRCSACGKKVKPIFKPTADPLDWLFRDCDECYEIVCANCSEVDEATGKCQCHDCYQGEVLRRTRSKE